MCDARYYLEDQIGDYFFVRVEDDNSYGGDQNRGRLIEIVFFRHLTITLGARVNING